MAAEISKTDIEEELFGSLKSKKTIEEILMKEPFLLSKEVAHRISNKTLKIPDYTLYKEDILKENLKNKISEEILGTLINYNNKLFATLKNLKKKLNDLGLNLNKEEEDYLAVIAYKQSKDINKLSLSFIVNYLMELINSANTPKADESMFTEEEVDIGEEKVIEIAQNSLMKIAEKMKARDVSLMDLYGNKLRTHGEDGKVLTVNDFFEGLGTFGIKTIDSTEYACLVKVLSLQDDERYIKFEYLIEALNDYGITTNIGSAKEKVLDFEAMDDISMIIMFALTEYLKKSNITLHEFLGHKIYKQKVQTKSSKKNVEVVDLKDFFESIEIIGVSLEDKEHEALANFLCIDPAHKDKLAISKIKKTLEEFATNQELKHRAMNCYEEMANEMDNADYELNDEQVSFTII